MRIWAIAHVLDNISFVKNSRNPNTLESFVVYFNEFNTLSGHFSVIANMDKSVTDASARDSVCNKGQDSIGITPQSVIKGTPFRSIFFSFGQ